MEAVPPPRLPPGVIITEDGLELGLDVDDEEGKKDDESSLDAKGKGGGKYGDRGGGGWDGVWCAQVRDVM